MHAQGIALTGNVLRRWREPHRHRLVLDASLAADETAAPDDDRHAERVRTLRHLLPDVPVTEQPDRAPEQPARLRELLLVPFAGPELRDVVGHAAIQAEQQRERELRNGD